MTPNRGTSHGTDHPSPGRPGPDRHRYRHLPERQARRRQRYHREHRVLWALPVEECGCYAQNGPLGWMVGRMDKHVKANDISVEQIARDEAAAIDGLWSGLPLRLHVAGDCRTDETAQIVSAAAERYSKRNRQGSWTYTHAWRAVERASWGAVSVLASCETPDQAVEASEQGYAAALVVSEYPNGRKAWTLPTGQTAIPCPQTTRLQRLVCPVQAVSERHPPPRVGPRDRIRSARHKVKAGSHHPDSAKRLNRLAAPLDRRGGRCFGG